MTVFLSGKYPPITSNVKFIRRALIHLFGERCTRCGWSERHPLTGNVPIEVEHIDGDWRNNAPGNLTLLCPNCHSLTATFRALNRGRGRADRLGGRGGTDAPRMDRAAALALHKELLRRAAEEAAEVPAPSDVQLPLLVAEVPERLKGLVL